MADAIKTAATTTTTATEGEGKGRGYGRTLTGVVKSNKMAKTIVVEVVRTVRHAKYAKFLKKRARYYAHDEKGEAGVGDKVIIVESRPLSKLKRWRLQNIAQKASV